MATEAGAGAGPSGRLVRGEGPAKGEPGWVCEKEASGAEVGRDVLRQVEQGPWGPPAVFGHPQRPVRNTPDTVPRGLMIQVQESYRYEESGKTSLPFPAGGGSPLPFATIP